MTGKLFERHEKQCCGGEVVDNTMMCCGGEVNGHSYTKRADMSCCGPQYIANNTTLCCTSDTGHIKVINFCQ